MRFKFLVLALVFNTIVNAQAAYWQQKVNYEMEIDFDTSKHQYAGKQKLTYFNNSPDTLNKVFYHLYFNAFQPNSMMDVRSRTIIDPDYRVRDRIQHLNADEIGFQKINTLHQDGKKVKYEVAGTILEVELAHPIFPNTSSVFEMDYQCQVPIQIRRSGRHNAEGIDYSMTQWYPKMCEYDVDGWSSNPYVGREFHGVWGDFDVKIKIDSGFMIGGTGNLQNPNEIGFGYEDKSKPVKRSLADGKLTWHFKAKNVHDFAWAADPNFTMITDTLKSGMLLHFIFDKDTLYENWDSLRGYAAKMFEIANKRYGVYPYQRYSIIQGGDGGMEYPMATLISAYGSFRGLVSVTVHEAMHSWYQGMLATNESKYAWMDEGLTTYTQYYIMNELFQSNKLNFLDRSYTGYTRMALSGAEEPLTTHADHFITNRHCGTSSYSKGAVLAHQLSYVIGMKAFNKGMKDFYNQWKFKHPTPTDFKRVMEKASGIELDWYFEQFVGTVNQIDYGIKQVHGNDKKTTIVIEKIGEMPMPLDVVVKLKNGKQLVYHIPLRIMRGQKGDDIYEGKGAFLADWPWTFPFYEFSLGVRFDQIKEIEIDPSKRMADVNLENNKYPSYNKIKFVQ